MSATGALSGPQFGSVADGTYDVEAHRAWHREAFKDTRRGQLREMNNRRAASFNAIGEARRAGNLPRARSALARAVWDRRTEQSWRQHLIN
jgi:hypothetical protein